jgi:hypothetical protein
MSSHILVYPHLQVQDASSGSVESMRSALADPLLTRSEFADHLNLPVLLSERPSDHCHVQNDGDAYQDEDISDEDFWVSLVSSCDYSIFC